MERHQPLKEDNIGRTNISRLFQPRMLDEGILRNFYSAIALNKIDKCFVCQVKVKSIRMVKVVLGDIDLRLIDTCMDGCVLL